MKRRMTHLLSKSLGEVAAKFFEVTASKRVGGDVRRSVGWN